MGVMSRRLREIVLLSLGVITPLGILAVNISAFVMGHLPALRLVIAGCALVSGLVLNGLTAWWLLRLASKNANPLYREYRRWEGGIASVIVASFMLLLPFAVTIAGRRMAGMGGIIPVDEPPGKERSRSRRAAL